MEMRIQKGSNVMRELCHAVQNRLCISNEGSIKLITGVINGFE